MKKTFWYFSLLFFVLMLGIWGNCNWMGNAIGQDDQIIVFADSLDWRDYEDVLNSVFGTFIKTPIPEREFILEWVPFDNFKPYENHKNIFLLGRLDSQLPVSKNIKNLLNEEIIQKVKNGNAFFIPKDEPWAVNQYVLFLVANNRDDMIQRIIDYGDLIYSDFRKFYFGRLKNQMFKRMEQKDLEKYITEHFPFSIRIQHDYFIADENLIESYVWIRRLHPDRSLTVHWLPIPENFQLTSRWVIDERNNLAKKIYKGDVVVEEETKAFSVQFKKWNAVRLEGTWRNDSLVIGGPFRNISFIDYEFNRIYMLDFYVQAIGQRKKPFLDQLDVIVHTFNSKEFPKSESAHLAY